MKKGRKKQEIPVLRLVGLCCLHETKAMHHIRLEKESIVLHLILVCVNLVILFVFLHCVRCSSVSNHTLPFSSHLNSFLRTLFCCTHHGLCRNHWDTRKILYMYTRVKYFYWLFIQYTSCIMWKECSFVKRSAVHLPLTEWQCRNWVCLEENMQWLLTIVSYVLNR